METSSDDKNRSGDCCLTGTANEITTTPITGEENNNQHHHPEDEEVRRGDLNDLGVDELSSICKLISIITK